MSVLELSKKDIDSVQMTEMMIDGSYHNPNPNFLNSVVRAGYEKGGVLGEKDMVKIANSAEGSRKIKNSLGTEVDITTLTDVLQGVVDQKFYEVNIADYMNINVGQGAWNEALLKWRSFDLQNPAIEDGDLELGRGKISSVDTGVDAISIPLQRWGKKAEYTLFEMKMASQTRVWDVVQSLERAKRRNFDLGLQRMAFLGHRQKTDMKGLLNQSGVTVNTDLIQKKLADMTSAELTAFASKVLGVYYNNSASTTLPNTFVIPADDYLGLTSPYSPDFPGSGTRLEILNKAFKEACGDDFKILKSAYSSQDNNDLAKNRYALYHRDADNLSLFLPIPFTTALQGTLDNFNFTSISYAQYGPVVLLREKTMLYMDYAN